MASKKKRSGERRVSRAPSERQTLDGDGKTINWVKCTVAMRRLRRSRPGISLWITAGVLIAATFGGRTVWIREDTIIPLEAPAPHMPQVGTPKMATRRR